MATIKFPSEMNQASSINDNDKIMIGREGVAKPLKIPFSELKNNLEITGIELEPVQGGATQAEATVIQAGPSGQNRKMDASHGWYSVNGVTVEATKGNVWKFFWNGTSWSLVDMGELPTVEGTNEIVEGGSELVNQDGVYKSFKKIDDKLAVVVDDQSSLVPVFIPTSGGSVMYEASTFSGWGTNYGVIKNFNFIKVFYRNLEDLGLPKVTRLKYRVCETDRSGAVLAQGEVDVNFNSGESGFIDIELANIIENTNNSDIWFEFWGNGNMGYYRTLESVSMRFLRYKTTTQNFNLNYAQESSVTSSEFNKLPDVKFYRNEILIVSKKEFADDVLDKGDASNVIDIENNKAVSGAGVKKALEPFEDIISLNFIVESSVAIGERNILTAYSTFSGWGQRMGVQSGFNAIRFPFRPYDENNMPTYCTLTIRNGSNTGEILFQKRIDGIFKVNTTYELIFELGYIFTNPNNYNLFVQYHADGYFACIGTGGGQTSPLYYIVGKNNPVLTSTTTNQNVLRTEFLLGSLKGAFTENAKDQIQEIVGNIATNDPELLLTSRVWLYPNIEYNIFNKNVIVPEFGDNVENYRADYNGSYGRQYKRGYRLNPINASLSTSLSLSLYDRSRLIATKTQLLLSAGTSTGNGNTRNVLIVGDSTVNGSNISIPLRLVFNNDSMNINLIGTLGASGVKHEGRGGWTVNDYYGIGRVLYVINVSGLTTAPSVNAVYSQGGVNYTVVEVNMTGGSGYFSLQSSSSNRAVDASGTLTKASGSGDDSIAYSSSSTTSTNPFYNPDPTVKKFDIGYYLSQTGQTLIDNDWIFFQLGINDVFGITSQTDAVNKTNTMLSQMTEIIDNIHTYNANIRIGLVVTFPPAGQDAFGTNYSLGQTSEKYTKTGLLTWQKKLIETFDNTTSWNSKTYLVSAHLNIDTEYNYPSSQVAPNARYSGSLTVDFQSNGVHPASSGYAQIADMYAGLIKYFG